MLTCVSQAEGVIVKLATTGSSVVFLQQNNFFLFIRSENTDLCNAGFHENHDKELAREQMFGGGARGSWANFIGEVFPFLSHF